jgi:hypothetical protein
MTTDRIKLSLFHFIADNLQIGYYGTWVIGSSAFYQCKQHFSFEPFLFNSEILEGGLIDIFAIDLRKNFDEWRRGRHDGGISKFVILATMAKIVYFLTCGERRWSPADLFHYPLVKSNDSKKTRGTSNSLEIRCVQLYKVMKTHEKPR